MHRTLLALTMIWATVPNPARAEPEKPILSVEFDLAEENYRDVLEPPDERKIKEEVEKNIRVALNGQFGFIDFAPDPQNDRLDRLIVKLGKRTGEPGAEGIRPIRFWVRAEGPRLLGERGEVNWVFRTLEQFNESPGAVENFIKEISSKFAQRLGSGANQLVEKVMSNVLLSDEAHPWPEQGGWVLPFTRDQLRVAQATKFEITAMITTELMESLEEHKCEFAFSIRPGAPVPVELHSKIFVKVIGAHHMQDAISIEAREIFLTEYRRLPNHLLKPAKPAELKTGGEQGNE